MTRCLSRVSTSIIVLIDLIVSEKYKDNSFRKFKDHYLQCFLAFNLE